MTSAFPHDDWLMLKHRTKPRSFGFGCGERDNDWSFADTQTDRAGYTLRSSETPIQLLNNYGGMDEDEDTTVKDVWYPQHHQHQQTDADSGLGTSPATDPADVNMGMDVDMDMEMDTTDTDSIQSTEQMQELPTASAAPSSTGSTACKRKRDVDFDTLEMNTGMAGFPMQRLDFDTAKRVRVSV